MQIDRSVIEKELAGVRSQAAQAQQVLAQAQTVIVQAAGAEKALNAMLAILDMEEPPKQSEGDDEIEAALRNQNPPKPRGTSARKSNGHAEGATS